MKFYSEKSGKPYKLSKRLAIILNLAKLHFDNGNKKEAEKCLVKMMNILNITPTSNVLIENPFVLKILIYYYLSKNQYNEAMSLVKTKKLNENNPFF